MSVGREYQHLEDLVYINGTQGILQAIDFLKKSRTVHVKYDGYSVVEFKTTEYFSFATSNSKKQGFWFTSTDELRDFIVNSGKKEHWRKEYADDLCQVFLHLKTLEQSGSAELLWSEHRPPKNNTFAPNLVTYTSQQPITQKTGIAIHQCDDPSKYNNSIVSAVCDRVTAEHEINTKTIDQLLEIADSGAPDILTEREYGLSDIKQIFYRYANWCSQRNHFNLANALLFNEWLDQARLTPSKKKRLEQRVKQCSAQFESTFRAFELIEQEKNALIHKLDQQPRSYQEHTNGIPGGEGYVCQKNKIKLVPRQRWKPTR